MVLSSKLEHPTMDAEGYFKFYDYLINMHAEYLRSPLPSYKTAHARNQALSEFELTVMFINPYCPTANKKRPLKEALDILSEIAESDHSKSDIWRGDTDVRLAKLNILAYQHPFFTELTNDIQENVCRFIREKFPSILRHPPGQRNSEIDPLLDRMWHPDFKL